MLGKRGPVSGTENVTVIEHPTAHDWVEVDDDERSLSGSGTPTNSTPGACRSSSSARRANSGSVGHSDAPVGGPFTAARA